MHLFLVGNDRYYAWRAEPTPSKQYFEKYIGLFHSDTIELISNLLHSMGCRHV